MLLEVCRVVLVVSLTSVAGERLFSTSDTITSDYPSNFKSYLAEQLCFLSQNWSDCQNISRILH